MQLRQYLPFLDWIPQYTKAQFRGDLPAGLTVGVMLIPQGMAYSMIAGLPPIYGLYASTIPLIIYALLGTSRQLAVGPVAMVSLLTASGIGALAESGSETYIGLAILLALLVGLVQLLLGIFRLGFLVNFLSHPVISGFTSAAALIIGFSQLKHLLGVNLPESHHIHTIIGEAIQKAGDTHLLTLGIGIAGILVIKYAKKIHKAIPGSLVAVVLGILAVWGLGLSENGVKIVGDIPAGLPAITLPGFTLGNLQALFPTVMAIALVSFMESIAVAKAIQARHKTYKVVPNQELLALGMANIGGAFFQSFPTTGGFSRTAVNDQAGAKTGMASLISAGLILITLLFLTPLFYYLPKAILAAVIVVAVAGLVDFKEPLHLWKTNRTDFAMLLATFIFTLALGIEQGIGIGVVLSLAMLIYRTTRPHMAILGRVPGTTYYRNIARFDNLEIRPELLITRFDAQLYFANINYFTETLEDWIARKGPGLKTVIINAAAINYVDSTAVHALEELTDSYRKKGIDFYFAGVKGPMRDALSRAHFTEKTGDDHFFLSTQDAVDAFDQKLATDTRKGFALQTNHHEQG